MNRDPNSDEVKATIAICLAFFQDTRLPASFADDVSDCCAPFLGLDKPSVLTVAEREEVALNSTGRWSHLMDAVDTLRRAQDDGRLHELLELLTDVSLADGRYEHEENQLIATLARLWDLHESPVEAGAAWSVLQAPSVTPTEWHPIHDLAVLYIGIAHRTDNELTADEVAAITRKLAEWLPDSLPDDVTNVIESAMSAYSRGDHDRILDNAMHAVEASVPDHQRSAVLNDLMYIARADRVVLVEERNLIARIAQAWGIDPSTIE